MSKLGLNLGIPTVIFICAILGGLSFRPLQLPLFSDNIHQFFISERAASGVPPHISQLSAKHSLSFILTGVAINVGRSLGLDDLLSARALSLLLLAGSAALAVLITFDLVNNWYTAAISGLSLMAYPGLVYQAAQGSRPKVFLVFFMLLAVAAAVHKRPFWLGVFAALSFLCWQPALILFASALSVGVFQGDRGRWLGRIILGGLAAVLAYEAYFWMHGALAEQLRQSYYFPALYMSGQFYGLNSFLRLFYNWVKAYFWHPAPFLSVVAAMKGGKVVWDSGFKVADLTAEYPGWAYIGLCFGGALGFSIYELQGYPDLFFILPFMTVLTGVGILILWNSGRFGTIARLLAGLSAASLIVLIFAGPYLMDVNYPPGNPYSRYTLQDQRRLAMRVKQLSEERGDIYVIGCAHLLAFNRMDNWSKNSAFFRGVRDYLLDTYSGGPEVPWEPRPLPPVVITCRYKLPDEIRYVLSQKYVLRTNTDFQKQEINVWYRRE